MKKAILYFFMASLVLTSCSTEQQEETKATETKLLKSYKIVKDAQGRYSIGYSTNNNATAELIKNLKTNTNEIHLLSEGNAKGNIFKEDLAIERNQLKIGFIENNTQRRSVTIEDKNIVLARGEESTEYLKEYSVEELEDNQYEVEFEVGEGVRVEYVYNEEIDTYEIHLKAGESSTNEHSKVYTRTSETLKVDFVNHITTTAGRGKAYASRTSVNRRPRWVIHGGDLY